MERGRPRYKELKNQQKRRLFTTTGAIGRHENVSGCRPLYLEEVPAFSDASGLWSYDNPGSVFLSPFCLCYPVLDTGVRSDWVVMSLHNSMGLSRNKKALSMIGILVGLVIVGLGWYLSDTPSTQGDWQEQLAVSSRAEFNGDTVMVRNVRNFRLWSDRDRYASGIL